jgi:hypothetical protein
LEDLATAQAVTPPEDLKSKIWSKIQQEQIVEEKKPALSAEIPEAKEYRKIDNRNLKRNTWKTYAIAASVLFLVSVAGNLYWMNIQSDQKRNCFTGREKGQDQAMQK